MSSSTQLTQQLAQLSDTLRQTNNLITRLGKLSFQPGSEPLADSTDSPNSVRLELAQDIHASLAQLEEDLDLLATEADDYNNPSSARRPSNNADRERDRTRVSALVARLTEDLRSSRRHFRRAQLTAKRASESAKKTERELVFASLKNPPEDTTNTTTPDLFAGRRRHAQQKQLTNEELELDASSTVTASLRRTHALLTTELSRSRFAQETFDQSTAALGELGEHYSNLDTILSASRNLLGTLLRSQKSDTWYLETAFYILLATLSWLVFRRLLWGPFFLLPRFLFNWFVWPPLSLIGRITGAVFGSGAAAATTLLAATGAAQVSSRTRPPLIVQPSAKRGSQPKIPEGMQFNVPAGGGGHGAKKGKEGLMSEDIGRMAEESRQKAEGRQGEDDGKVRRADGTLLEQRGEVPRNPKKKMFEADVEDEKYEEQKRRETEEAGNSGRRKRDEL